MYLLVGATGLLGGRIADRLVAHNVPVRALVRPGSDASALLLAGPEALTTEQLVQRWTELTGRPVKVSHVPRAILAIGSRVLRPFKPALASTMGMALKSDTMTVTVTDEGFQALGLRPRPVSQYLRGLAKASPIA
jgi:uncharacterized protein YbjT (DUF2867 family)